jgi:flagellar protein FliL
VAKENVAEKKKLPLKLILILLAVLLLIVGGMGWFFLGGEKGNTGPAIGKGRGAYDVSGEVIYSMEIFVVNLNDPGSKRYLKTKINLGYSGAELTDEIKQNLPQLRDAVLVLLSSKTVEAIQGTEGIITLRQELIQRINLSLKKGKIKNLYFTEFVIQ